MRINPGLTIASNEQIGHEYATPVPHRVFPPINARLLAPRSP